MLQNIILQSFIFYIDREIPYYILKKKQVCALAYNLVALLEFQEQS